MSKPLPWFRMHTKTVDNESLRLLAFEDRWHFVALLCCKGNGLLDKGDDPALMRRRVAVKLGLSSRELEEVARRLAEVELIDPETLQPLSWDELQFQSDSSTARVKAHRERVKRECNVSETAASVSVSKSVASDVALDLVACEPKSFEDWWQVYPKKIARKQVEQLWRRRKLDPIVDVLIADVLNRVANDDGWQRGYAPNPTTYINQDRWEDAIRDPPRATAPVAAPSKTLTAMQQLQGMKNGLVRERDNQRLDQTAVLELGRDACARLGAGDRSDVD